MSNYQGHMADGSSIQKHSAGGAYPYVLQLRVKPREGYYWELLGPGIGTALRFDSSAEWDAAVRRILAVRESDDAWAFELEQLCTLAGQKLAAMRAAASLQRVPALWQNMSQAERVEVLLNLGRSRNALRLPPGGQPPVFAQLAGAML